MRISGYGEFQQMRKLVQKDDPQNKDNAERAEQNAGDSDAVLISAEARRKGKLRQASDYRQAKVDDVKARLEAGTLVTPESLRSGTRKMLDGMLNGDI